MPDELAPDTEARDTEERDREERLRAEEEARKDRFVKRELARRSRRSFLTGGVTALGALGAWEWIKTRRPDSGTPWPLRRILDTNEEISRDYFRTPRLAAQYPVSESVKNLRVNERIGMKDILVPAEWSLKVDGADIETDEDDNSATLHMDAEVHRRLE